MALRVIGAGVGRTGTDSLRRALETLGLAPCHHMFALRDDPERVPPWLAVARGAVEPDWDALFAGFEAQVDWPGAAFWYETAAHFPDARVILSVRDPDAWHASLAATILPFVEARGRHAPPHRNDIAEVAEHLLRRELGDPFDAERAKAAFEARNARVVEEIAPERLLVLPLGAGWEPLCAFLDRPVPALPYPSGNSSAEFRARAAPGRAQGEGWRRRLGGGGTGWAPAARDDTAPGDRPRGSAPGAGRPTRPTTPRRRALASELGSARAPLARPAPRVPRTGALPRRSGAFGLRAAPWRPSRAPWRS